MIGKMSLFYKLIVFFTEHLEKYLKEDKSCKHVRHSVNILFLGLVFLIVSKISFC